MNIGEMRRQYRAKWEAAQKFLNANTDADGKISQVNAERYKQMEKELDDLDEEVFDRLGELDDFLSKPASPTCPLPLPGDNPFSYAKASRPQKGVYGAEYHKNFIQEFRQNFRTAQNTLREASLPDGGYLVPAEFEKELVTQLAEECALRQIGRVITTASEHKINIVASRPTAEWVSEGQAINLSSETFGRVNLSAFKLCTAVKTSNELLQDSFYDLETALIRDFAITLAQAEEEAMITGDGNNKPLGILPKLATSASTTITTATANITADDILNLQYALPRQYRKSACFLTSDAVLAQIRKLKDSTSNYIWQPNTADGKEPPLLFGVPVYTSPFMPSAESGNVVIVYGDFKNYYTIGDRGERQVKPLRELFALSDETAFLMVERLDAVITNLSAFKALQLK